jgi:hypothetical protein
LNNDIEGVAEKMLDSRMHHPVKNLSVIAATFLEGEQQAGGLVLILLRWAL